MSVKGAAIELKSLGWREKMNRGEKISTWRKDKKDI